MKLWQKVLVVMSTLIMLLAMALPAMAQTHVVQQGDTLWDLYGTRAPAVAAANGIANPDLIFPGQRIHTGNSVSHHASGVHVVRPGDTLWKLVGTRWPSVAQANGLSNPDLILPGQHLNLSGGVEAGSTLAVVVRQPAP